ncbi:MAG TPA: GNAT family N-acetyltransferase [Beijerinckiaceae bacterium]|nr:GNAT family N-acetyltransferase [Beijerinckiaceae bacterium]
MAVLVKRGWRPGLIGEVVTAQALYYAREWGFGLVFETKVAREMAAFLDRYDPKLDRLFSVEDQGRLLGSLAIDGGDPDLPAAEAHLRWFILTDAARGHGIGRLLMSEAMSFLTETGFRSCHLTTFAGLTPARRLYEAAGFTLVGEQESLTWGKKVVEQRFVVDLRAGA